MKTTLQTPNKSKNSKTSRISTADTKELFQLKRTINDSADAVESLVKSVKDKSRQALAEALTCGKALLRAKEIMKYGQFEKWCKENCKNITQQTRSNYMRLANNKHVGELLTTGIGLRQAYISIGILKEDDSTPSETSASPMWSPARASDVALNGSTHASVVTKGLSRTPLADTLAHASGRHAIVSAKPTITKDDALSRARLLVNELVFDINSKLTSGHITRSDVKAELKPLAEFMR